MDFTQEQEMILLLIGWVTLMAGFIIFNKIDDQKKIIRTFYKNRLEWSWNKNQEHEEKTSKKEK